MSSSHYLKLSSSLVKNLTSQIMVRQFEQGTGLEEHGTEFGSLAELYQACLTLSAPQLVDRIVLRGEDEQGQERTLTFVFQSLTVTPPAS
jgi:hypothetical protein